MYKQNQQNQQDNQQERQYNNQQYRQQNRQQNYNQQNNQQERQYNNQQDRQQDRQQNNQITISGNTLSKISFCDKQCSNVNDNKVKGQIIQSLESKYNIQAVSRDYNIVNPNTLRIISFHQHLITPFTNGNPYLLYLTKNDGINCCFYIDKKLKDGYTFPKMHCVKYRFNNDLFDKETIFSGELVKDNERRWFFLIDNILLYKGMNTSEKNIISKFELIHSILNNEYQMDKYLEICPLQVKKLFLYKDIRKMVNDFIPNLSYTCKGIAFYTLNNKCSNFAFLMPRDAQFEIKSPNEINEIVQDKYPKLWEKKHTINNDNIHNTYIPNFDNTTTTFNICGAMNAEKLENADNADNADNAENIENVDNVNNIENVDINNVVFKILKTDIPDIYNLYCIDTNNQNNLYKHSIALVPNIKVSHYLYNTFKSNPNNLGLKVECKFSKIFEKWMPIQFVNNEPFNKNIIESIEDKMKDKE